jgi:prepilin-type N-terminal cleavage/methylation domain-containing protein
MNKFKQNSGFTLVEMIVVIAIITILAGVLLKVGGRVAQQSRERQTKATIDILDSALEQFAAEGFDYKYYHQSGYTRAGTSWIKFPPDCNGFSRNNTQDEIADALDDGVAINYDGTYNYDVSGCGAMYFFLNRQPESREVLKNIDKSVVTNKKGDLNNVRIKLDSEPDYQPFYWIVDAWGEPLRYDYYDENMDIEIQSGSNNDAYDTRRSFPLVISAGPDGDFNTKEDNITNKK